MGLRKWVASGLRIATSWVPGLGTAVEEGLDHWKERLERKSALASLLDIAEHTWRPDSSPAALLRADFGIVPFHGRAAEIEDLTSWCDGASPLALRLYTAPGGFGKTRLLRHFVRLRGGAGWDAGFLPEGALREGEATALFEARKKPLFLVLDYAESRRSEIETVVSAARSSSRKRVRVVLLARSEGDWWAELKMAAGGVGDFFQGPAVAAPIPLLPLTDSIEARQDSYRRAVHAFAEALGKPQDGAVTAPAPPLDDEDFERVLLVHAAALAAVEGEQVPSGKLLDWLLRREERGIERVRERQAGLGPELQRAVLHAAALVTLAQGADSRTETVEIIRRAPSLKDQPRVRLDKIAEALHVLYRGRRWCDGVEPDLVGEHLVWRQLTDAPEVLGAAFGEGIPEAQLESGLAVLNRLAQRQPESLSLLSATMESDLARLALPAARVAIAGGDPIGLVLAEALAQARNAQIARQLDGHLPHLTTALREAAAEVEGILLSELRQPSAEEMSGDAQQEAARRTNDLSNRLADLGRREEALRTIKEAIELYRNLVRSRPEHFQPELGMSLSNLSLRLRALGRREEALAAIQEAVEVFRGLAHSRGDAFQGNFALGLTNLSGHLSGLERQEEALEAIEEAVEVLRGLAHSLPEAFRPDLALSLNNLSACLSLLGRREEALEAIKQAVEIRRELAQSRPDAFRPDLAMSLINLSNCLAVLGRGEEALEAIGQAVEIYRTLSRSRTEAFRADLATGLGALSQRLRMMGRTEAAFEAITEALDLLEPVFQKFPRAFFPIMGQIVKDHERAAKAAGVQPDQDRLRSIREVLKTMQDAR